MNRNEVVELMKKIKLIYPQFEVTEESVNLWAMILVEADGKRVGFRLSKHLAKSQFPPKPAEIYAEAPPENEALNNIRAYEEKIKNEKEKITPEDREEMNKKLENLMTKLVKNDK